MGRTQFWLSTGGILIWTAVVGALLLSQGLLDIAIMAAILPVAALIALSMNTFPWAAKLISEDLYQVHRLRWWDRPAATVRAVTTDPRCARGYQAGDTWTIDEHGTASPFLCQAAALALEDRVFPEDVNGKNDVLVVCNCPLGDRAVTFAVHAMTANGHPTNA